MDTLIPDYVSYEMLLAAICLRPVSGRTPEELRYMVQLAEELSRHIREVLDNRR